MALTALAVAVLGAELAHRLWFYGPAGLVPSRLASVRPLGETDFIRRAEWPEVGYRLRAHQAGWFKLQRFTTSSEGLRDGEYPREKPPSTFRIAVVGDSYTMGSGVADGEPYEAVLERALNRRDGAVRYELINFGVGGYSLLHELGVVERMALAWDPDLILLGVVDNDAHPPAPEERPEAYRGAGTSGSGAPTAFLRLTLLDRYRSAGRRPDVSASDPDYLPDVFGRIREACAAAEVPVFCAYLATAGPELAPGAAEPFERAARAAGFGFLDTSPAFAEVDRGAIIILPNDGHPNAASHRRYAEALERALADGGWLDAQ